MKIILCGYNWVGCEVLTQLINNKDVSDIYVYTHNSPPHIVDVSGYCAKIGVDFTIDKISIANLPFVPDIICSIYYKNIIDSRVIEKCNGKIFNLHPSLLPNYRGCSSITWAIINGEKKIGYTYHYIEKGIDTGNILLQNEVELHPFETQQSMYYRMMFEGAQGFNQAFNLVKGGDKGREQEGYGDYYKRGAPHKGIIDNQWEEEKIERFIRAMNNPPMPFATTREGKEIKTLREYSLLKGE